MNSDTALFIILFLVILLDFLKDRHYYSDRRYLIAGILSRLFILLFIVLFILDADKSWLYLVIGIGLIPGAYFQILRFRKDLYKGYLKVVPGILAIIIMVYIVIKVLI
jgi:hypothetical protein